MKTESPIDVVSTACREVNHVINVTVWVVVDLFSVTRWVAEYNQALLAKIQSGQG